MINKNLLDKEVQKYIVDNLSSDLSEIRLKKSPFKNVTSLEIVQQIQGKKIAITKFPFLSKQKNIIYPPHINLEQASTQSTALFKQKIIKGEKGIDLTGGTGIDSYFISEYAKEFYFIEPDVNLMDLVIHNFQALNRTHINFINNTAENFLNQNQDFFNFIYLDPSRRDENKNKKFLLEDLFPNILQIRDILTNKSTNVYIKLSPLLDIQKTVEQLNLSDIYILAVKNEVKELLVKLNPQTSLNTNPHIHCFNLETFQPEFSFYKDEEKNITNVVFSSLEKYLFMPNNSILKSGAFKLISLRFNLKKLHPNTHLYTSDNFIENFPGRIFEIIETDFSPSKNIHNKYNIINRNYPLNTEQIKKKYSIKEGGENYIFFTCTINKNICFIAKRII
ncbi:class I SAM-dependent methyltransferase [Apibacter adventoris]|uniref:class I SAM-dependent methyltransferase n=1 Tax=Apibacter adventoris TaxID=1679466 RepID=UPI0021A78958|nr:class I SAM-dependent methyltransferase [Apibacter adventoris]